MLVRLTRCPNQSMLWRQTCEREAIHLSDADSITGRLCSIPAGSGFLDTLALAILTGEFGNRDGEPISQSELASITLLLPTRRAVRGLQDAFLTASEKLGRTKAVILPKLRPISEGDDVASLLSGLAHDGSMAAGLDIVPAVSELERRVVLMRLIQNWSTAVRENAAAQPKDGSFPLALGAATPAQAAKLASELARFIDLIETESVPIETIAELVPDTYSDHWQQTLNFLEIVVQSWPQYLAAAGLLSPADRRNQVILAEAERVRRLSPDETLVVAGVTGSVPATEELMRAVLSLPRGVVVLPGFETQLDERDAKIIAQEAPEHPQFGLLKLMRNLGCTIDDVDQLASAEPTAEIVLRNRIVKEALRPASTTDQWFGLGQHVSQRDAHTAFENVSYIAAPSSQDEAEAIALILREAAEHPGRTAALISPDRLLARRVAIRLEAWGIRIDDSAGRPFVKTVTGAFLDLVIKAAADRFGPTTLMPLLKHPLMRMGRKAFDIRKAARALEIIAFRTPYLGSGLDGVEAAIEVAAQDLATGQRRGRAVSRLWEEDWHDARQLVADLKVAFAPLDDLFRDGRATSLAELAKAHIVVAEVLAKTSDDDDQASELWREAAGETAAQIFTGLMDPELPAPEIAPHDYPDFYRTLVAAEAVRSQVPTHPRIFIWGPFEARLLQPDVVILGALNEGTWPEAADPGPWLNRPMRRELGVPSPEEEIGRSAHDFTQLLGAETVYLTRSEIVDGNPSVPSRWILRLQTVLRALDASDAFQSEERWLTWARRRNVIGASHTIQRPEPKPPLHLRPRRLSVSAVETWIANPYALFAQQILKLDALPALGEDPGASLRGTIVHDALGQFARKFPNDLPDDVAQELLRFSKAGFERLGPHPRVRAFWISRFERFADWFGATESERRSGFTETLGEVTGSYVLDAPGGPFTLTARADRIDIGADGVAITDYKTGANLSELVARAKDSKRPQLLLEAVIASHAGFTGVQSTDLGVLKYISASGGEPPGNQVEIGFDDLAKTVTDVAGELARLVARYDNEDTPYSAVRRAQFRYDFDAYAHLARIAEWDSAGGDEAGS